MSCRLGAAALAGTTYPIDPEYVATLLDFPKVTKNSIDAVSDRDFIIEFLAGAVMCMTHLSRLSEELILWSTIGVRIYRNFRCLYDGQQHHAPEKKSGCS